MPVTINNTTTGNNKNFILYFLFKMLQFITIPFICQYVYDSYLNFYPLMYFEWFFIYLIFRIFLLFK